MKNLSVMLFASVLWAAPLFGQQAATETQSEKKSAEKQAHDAKGGNEAITTEIYADEAFFDSTKNIGTFSRRVRVLDPRFNLQSDKLTVFISKGGNQGLEKAIAQGNVAMVKERPESNGGSGARVVGRAEMATYVAATGDIELKGEPRVQQGVNTHIGTGPETVMIINQNGQLTTHGPSRTEIRQEPKEEKSDVAKPASPRPL